MAKINPASVATLVAGIPVPMIPTTNDPRQLVMFHKQLLDYIRTLMQTLTAASSGGLLPPIPDPSKPYQLDYNPDTGQIYWNTVPDPAKDYIWAYDSGTQRFKWIETTEACPT